MLIGLYLTTKYKIELLGNLGIWFVQVKIYYIKFYLMRIKKQASMGIEISMFTFLVYSQVHTLKFYLFVKYETILSDFYQK